VKTDITGQEAVRASSGVVDAILHRVRVARREASQRRERAAITKRGPTVQERQSELVHFYERYEELVEALCDAAQYGPNPKLERAYAAERDWMEREYPRLRSFLSAYLRSEREDAALGLSVAGRKTDAFEALVAAETLDELLRGDDGSMISRITRTREALILYGEHLRQLAARIA
jgi:hypothetical protein